MRCPAATRRHLRRGFSLVEVLVVIGIIALLIALLLPAVSRARVSARTVVCAANLTQVHTLLVVYSQANKDWMFQPGLGAGNPRDQRWQGFVFGQQRWNQPSMLSPADADAA